MVIISIAVSISAAVIILVLLTVCYFRRKTQNTSSNRPEELEPNVSNCVNYTRENAQLVPNLQQTCGKLVGTSLLQDLYALLAPSLLASCYKPAKLDELNSLATSCSNINLLSCCKSTTCQQLVSNKLGTT